RARAPVLREPGGPAGGGDAVVAVRAEAAAVVARPQAARVPPLVLAARDRQRRVAAAHLAAVQRQRRHPVAGGALRRLERGAPEEPGLDPPVGERAAELHAAAARIDDRPDGDAAW